MKRGIDEACFDLARHFLGDVTGSTLVDEEMLAEEIQEVCEPDDRSGEEFMTPLFESLRPAREALGDAPTDARLPPSPPRDLAAPAFVTSEA